MLTRMKFTKPAIDKIDCTDKTKPTFFWDERTPGFGVKVTPKNNKSYIFQGRIGLQNRRIKIGDVDTWKLDDARKYAQELAIMCHKGIDPLIERKKSLEINKEVLKQEKRKNIKFKDVWQEYLKARKPNWSPRSYQDHLELSRGGLDLNNNLYTTQPIHQLFEFKLSELTADLFCDWFDHNDYRPTTSSRSYRLVRAFLNWCEESDEYESLIPSKSYNSKKVKDKVPPPRAKNDCLMKQHLKQWFAEVNKLSSRKIAIFLMCSLITGCRKEELLSLKWKDIDFRWKTVKVKDKIEATGRQIPLTIFVESLLLELKKNSDSEFVFSSEKSECGYIVNPYDSLERICKILDIHLTPHGLRRSYRTLAIWAHINEGSLAQIAGHKPSALVERHYIVRPMDMLRETLQEYEDWILNCVRGGVN